jgi:hypothetical protein
MNNSTDVLYFWIGALCGVAALATIVVGVLYFRRKRERVKIKDDWEDVVGINTNSKRMRIFIGGKPIAIDTPCEPPAITTSIRLNAEDAISKLGATARAIIQFSDACIPITKDVPWLKCRLVAAEEAQDFELCAVIKKRLDELSHAHDKPQ